MYLRHVEQAWLKCERHRLRQQIVIEQSLQNYTMAGLLIEQDAGDVVSDLNAAADDANISLDDLLNRVPQKMGSVRDALTQAKNDIAKNRLKTGITLPNLMGGPLEQLSRMFGNIQILQGSIANAFKTVQGALGDLGIAIASEDEDRSKELGELLDMYSSGDAALPGIPTRSDFEKAITSQLKAPEGLFKGLGQGFSNLMGGLGLGSGRDVGFGLKQADFVDDMLQLTPDELDTFLKGAQDVLDDAAAPSADDPVQKLGDIIADAELDGEVADIGAQSEKEGGADDQAQGVPITQQHMKDIKSAMEKAKKGKKSQTRALGGALNKMIGGSPIFAEHRAYTYGEVKQVLKETLVSPRSYDDAYDDEDDHIRRRWLQLAGLKDE